MLQIEQVFLQLGSQDILNGISALINPGERIGLVGPNGAGKSSLLRLIAGELNPNEGTIQISKEETIGYLPQDGIEPDYGLTVTEEVQQAFAHLLVLEEQVLDIQKKLSNTAESDPAHDRLMEKFGELQNKLEQSGLYQLESDVERVLMGLGFREEDFGRPTTEFSGGWLMRIALAKLLLKKPDYLLLDEPTNHLDIESLQWMEQFLINYQGAVIVVSHDRAFLDTITTRTLALRNGQLQDYAGNYSFYERKWEEEKELLLNAKKNQEKQIKETEEFIEKFRYKATKARQVQSRIKQLEKIERIEIEDEQNEVSFRFPAPERSGQIVMTLEQIVKKYEDNIVFDGLNYEIERGDKIAVVGPNGAGKSTLIRILAGIEPFQSGERKEGYNVTTGYFAQHQADELDLNMNALDVMQTAGSGEKESRLRTLLGCFLFQGDDVFKKVNVLSGGEKSRLALARMLLTPANFLIFDEPTNHLDMASKQILQQALQQYEGTFVIVSHDRSFLDPIVDKVLEVQPQKIRTFHGNVSYYLSKKAAEQEQEEASGIPENGTRKQLSRKEIRRLEAEKRNERNRRLRPVKKKMEALEKEIQQMEIQKKELEALMAQEDFYDDSEKVKETSMKYNELKQELTGKYSKWEEYAMRLEAMEEEFS